MPGWPVCSYWQPVHPRSGTYVYKKTKDALDNPQFSIKPTTIVLRTSQRSSVRIARADIVSMELQNSSMMPQELDQLMFKQEMADLMASLLGQNQNPETDQAVLR